MEESEGEVAARTVSKVRIETDSDSDTDEPPSRKKRRRRNFKREPAEMEIDKTKNSEGSNFLKPTEPSSSARMEWESDPGMDSDDSWSYLDADDEQSDFPDAVNEKSPKPEQCRKTRVGMSPLVQRKIERFYYSNQRELLLTQILQIYPVSFIFLAVHFKLI